MLESNLAALERKFSGRFRVVGSSRRTMVWHETEHRLSTDDGRPLDPAATAAGVCYPWRQIALLRQRLCHAVEATAGELRPRHLLKPGQADMTLKARCRGGAGARSSCPWFH